jgi:hypothetical protein
MKLVVHVNNKAHNNSLKVVPRFARHWTVTNGACFAFYAPSVTAPWLNVRHQNDHILGRQPPNPTMH